MKEEWKLYPKRENIEVSNTGYRIDGSETREVVDRYIRQFNKASDFSFVRLNTPIKR